MPKLVIEAGLTFEYLEGLNLEQIGILLGYMSEKARGQAKLDKSRR